MNLSQYHDYLVQILDKRLLEDLNEIVGAQAPDEFKCISILTSNLWLLLADRYRASFKKMSQVYSIQNLINETLYYAGETECIYNLATRKAGFETEVLFKMPFHRWIIVEKRITLLLQTLWIRPERNATNPNYFISLQMTDRFPEMLYVLDKEMDWIHSTAKGRIMQYQKKVFIEQVERLTRQ